MTPQALAATHARAFTDSRTWHEDEMAALIASPHVAVTGDERCFVMLRVITDEAEILTVATDPDHRRQGLAARALAEAETVAASRGATQVFLEVAETNTAARALYDKAGYTLVGTRPDYYAQKTGTPVQALVLAKRIPPR